MGIVQEVRKIFLDTFYELNFIIRGEITFSDDAPGINSETQYRIGGEIRTGRIGYEVSVFIGRLLLIIIDALALFNRTGGTRGPLPRIPPPRYSRNAILSHAPAYTRKGLLSPGEVSSGYAAASRIS